MTKDEAILLFNIQPFYSEEELKERWHYLAKRHHPDLGHNPEYFKRLLTAYQTLKEYRKTYSAKQEWFDYVSRENQRAMHQVITQERQNAVEVIYMYPIIFITCPVLVGMPIVVNNYRYLQQLYSLQLKISVVSNKLMYVLQR
jgi:hypothetical protein